MVAANIVTCFTRHRVIPSGQTTQKAKEAAPCSDALPAWNGFPLHPLASDDATQDQKRKMAPASCQRYLTLIWAGQ